MDLLEIETKYNFKFPKEIREHYLEYNGGTLEKEIFKDSDGGKYIFNWFIPIDEIPVFSTGMGDIIACDSRGNFVILDYYGPKKR